MGTKKRTKKTQVKVSLQTEQEFTAQGLFEQIDNALYSVFNSKNVSTFCCDLICKLVDGNLDEEAREELVKRLSKGLKGRYVSDEELQKLKTSRKAA